MLRDLAMRASLALVGLFFAACVSTPAQHVTRLLAEPDGWTSEEVGDGVVLRQRWLPKLFAGPQSLTVLEIAAGSPARFDLQAPGRRTRTSVIGERADALAAINGGFFDIEGTGLSIGLLRLDGTMVVPANDGQASVGIVADGRVQLASRPAGDWPEVVDALGAGPRLLTAGQIVDHGERQRQRRHPRSAIGVAADGRVVLLTADGRTDKAAGMTFEETAMVLQALGCVDAVNLDGGGSTTLWLSGRGVCNFPCDNKRYDHDGERAVANALLVHAPAVVVVDDDAAELLGGAWRQRRDGEGVHGRDFAASDAAGARAVFRAELPHPGDWRVLARRPRTRDVEGAWQVELAPAGAATATKSIVVPGRWCELGTLHVTGDRKVAVALTTAAGALVVDAVRFVAKAP